MSAKNNAPAREINQLLVKLAGLDTGLTSKKTERDAEIEAINAKYAPEIDELTRERDQLVDQIAGLFQQNREALLKDDGKTVSLRSGKLSVRLSVGSLVVEDESRVFRALRRLGKLRQFTRIGKRTLDKTELKKHPEVVEKLPGLRIDKSESLTIKLTRTQSEIVKELEPFKRSI